MDMRIREWKKFHFLNPSAILVGLRDLAIRKSHLDFPIDLADLRAQEHRPFHEGHQAALFCLGMSMRLSTPIEFALAPQQARDYDFVARYLIGKKRHYCAVQLKELVPGRLNPAADLQTLLDGLPKKYPDSKDVVVAIHLNRAGEARREGLRVPQNLFREIWLFGADRPDQSKWFLIGDLLGNAPTVTEFDYPTASG